MYSAAQWEKLVDISLRIFSLDELSGDMTDVHSWDGVTL